MPDRSLVAPRLGQGASLPKNLRAPAPSEEPIRIVVADHTDLDRAGLTALLGSQAGFVVVAAATCADETVAAAQRHAGAMVVMSVRLPNRLGRPALPELLRRLPATRFLVISDRGARDCMVLNPPQPNGLEILGPPPPCARGVDCLELAIEQGAHGVVRRSEDARVLFDAIRTVARGGEARAGLRPRAATRSPGGAAPTLTSREAQVVSLIARGRSNKEIAEALDIALPTVKKHVGGALRKLGLQDRLQVGVHVARHPDLLAPYSEPNDD